MQTEFSHGFSSSVSLTLGKALGAGGLLLPWAGNGALALPADLGAAAQLPVAPAVPAISSDLAQLREVRRALHACYLRQGEQLEWRPLMVNHHRPLEKSIVGRRKPTWQDCTEIAEVAMWEMVRLGPQLTGATPGMPWSMPC